MGFQIDYVEVVKQVEELVEIMFEKMSRGCKYCDPIETIAQIGPNYDSCVYYGREGKARCYREDCPLLEEEE